MLRRKATVTKKKPAKKVVKKATVKRKRVVKRKPKLEVVTDYLAEVYDVKKYKRTVKRTLAALKKLKAKSKFQAIAFRGSSGAALAYVCAMQLGVPLMHVRKSNDGNHFGGAAEGVFGVERYVIVDDFISSGDTMRCIISKITKAVKDRNENNRSWYPESRTTLPLPTCVGIVLYAASARRAKDDKDRVTNLPKGSPIIRVQR